MSKKIKVFNWFLYLTIMIIVLSFFALNNLYFVDHLIVSVKSNLVSLGIYFQNIFDLEYRFFMPETFFDFALSNQFNYGVVFSSNFQNYGEYLKYSYRLLFNPDYLSVLFNLFVKNLFIFNIVFNFLLILILFFLVVLKLYFSHDESYVISFSRNYNLGLKIDKNIYIKFKKWLSSFWNFISTKKLIYIFFITFVVVFCGILSAALDLITYFLLFVSSFDIKIIFMSFYSTIYSFVPLFTSINPFIWLLIGYLLFIFFRYKYGIKKLSVYHHKNLEFTDSLGVCTFIKGPPGCGKTMLLTDLVLNAEEINRFCFIEIIDKYKKYFPYFNFNGFFNSILDLKNSGDLKTRYDVELLIDYLESIFNSEVDSEVKKDIIFDYDYNNFPLEIFNGLRFISLFECLKTTGTAYFYKSFTNPLAMGNFPIRFDYYVNNHKLVNNVTLFHYFNLKKEQIKSFTKFSHIINNDILRFGKKVNDDVPIALECFTIYLSEIDKERGNQFDKQGLKKSDSRANLVNDYFNLTLKLSRHFSTLDFKPFFRFFTDSQRVGSVNLDLIETNENIISISSSSSSKFVMPLFTIERIIIESLIRFFHLFINKYNSIKNNYDLLYLILNTAGSKINLFYEKILNLFYVDIKELSVDSGDSNVRISKYYLLHKKTLAARYSTDVYKCWFKTKDSFKSSFDDYQMFSSLEMSMNELNVQNSYMVKNIENLSSTEDLYVEKENEND